MKETKESSVQGILWIVFICLYATLATFVLTHSA